MQLNKSALETKPIPKACTYSIHFGQYCLQNCLIRNKLISIPIAECPLLKIKKHSNKKVYVTYHTKPWDLRHFIASIDLTDFLNQHLDKNLPTQTISELLVKHVEQFLDPSIKPGFISGFTMTTPDGRMAYLFDSIDYKMGEINLSKWFKKKLAIKD